MSHSEEQAVYREVRSLLPEMDPEMRAQAEALLAEAERGQKTDIALLKLIRSDPRLREILAARLRLTGSEAARSLYSPSAGDVSSPGARKFICPECGFTRYLQKAGEDPGVCPKDGRPLVPFVEQEEGQ